MNMTNLGTHNVLEMTGIHGESLGGMKGSVS